MPDTIFDEFNLGVLNAQVWGMRMLVIPGDDCGRVCTTSRSLLPPLSTQSSNLLTSLKDQYLPDSNICSGANNPSMDEKGLYFRQVINSKILDVRRLSGRSTRKAASFSRPSSGHLPFHTPHQISGLWIILGASLGLGLLSSCYGIYQHHIKVWA